MPRLVNGLEQIFTDLGIVGNGYKLFFFEYDTTTPKNTYSDQNLTIPNTNPVVCDASGRPESDIWGSDPSLYKMVLGTPNSTIDNIDAVVTLNPVDDLNNNSILSITPLPTAYWGATTGTSSNYVLNPALVGITSYNNQQCFFIDIHVACAAGAAININGIGSKTLKKYTQQGTKVSLIAGDLQVQRHLFINDGVDIICLNPIVLPLNSGAASALTIASGIVTITNNSSSYAIDTESSASSDDLDTINGYADGQIIYIRNADNARNVVVKHNTGNIWNPYNNISDRNITLDLTTDFVLLRYSAANSKWIVVSYSVAQANITLGTSVSASGTSVDFTGIPSWVNEICVLFAGVSTNGTSPIIIQLGSGSVQTSGYTGAGSNYIGTPAVANYTNGLGIEDNSSRDASKIRHGIATFRRITGNVWIGTHTGAYTNVNEMMVGATGVTLSGTLDRVRITTSGGVNTFDAGTINIQYS